MKTDTLHTKLVDLLTGYCYAPGSYFVKEGDETFSYIEKTLTDADTKTRKVLLHWLKGCKDRIALSTKYASHHELHSYMLRHPKTMFDQMLDHLDHLNYAQKIKAPVNYDPLSYRTHYDCLPVVTKYPLPAKPIDPNKFHYLDKVAEMFDNDNNCYTVYRFINRKKNPTYDSPKEAFTALMRSHFGKHAMPWCICSDDPHNFWNFPEYSRKYVVFKNNKLYAATATGGGIRSVLFDRTNKNIGALYQPCSDPTNYTGYLIRFEHTFQEDNLKLISAAASTFNRPVIPDCVHQNKGIELLSQTPSRCLSSEAEGLQWFLPGVKKVAAKQGLPPYSVAIRGEYTLPSSNILRYLIKLTVDNNNDAPLHTVTGLEIAELNMSGMGRLVSDHTYLYQMTKDKAASLIEQHLRESLARTIRTMTTTATSNHLTSQSL